MAAKLILLAVCVASALSEYYGPPQDYWPEPEHHGPKPYHFDYSVHDLHTHDIKSQYEHSDGHGNVKGSYSLVEPDGTKRIVEYTADHSGFHAKVKKEGVPLYSSPGPSYKSAYPAPSTYQEPSYDPYSPY
ncbi:cuticle protein 19-like [Adelges cooleyi]|uniref:cuticle protein 19-like n=1 Tax=Adelges cooleyi TaxID=133065 RepID=UPI0021808D97|nr:cuticle protein 19-like [Adelges cooleyi]